MSLYKEWTKLLENQNKKSFDKFWDEYSAAEEKIYGDILKNKSSNVSGVFSELVSKYGVSEKMFMGFLDGINSSIDPEIDVEKITDDTRINLSIDFEKLYFNMLSANADHLYTLPEWDEVLDEAKREEITDNYKRSRTVVKEKTPGRNDPCSCGSGKKYKKCCGV